MGDYELLWEWMVRKDDVGEHEGRRLCYLRPHADARGPSEMVTGRHKAMIPWFLLYCRLISTWKVYSLHRE